MSSGNRKIFDDNMPVSPLSMDSGIEEDLIGVENEENSGPSIITALVAVGVAILVGILAWYFGFGNQLEDFAQENRVIDQIKDWAIQFIQHISSIFHDRFLQ